MNRDIEMAERAEPLEQVIDELVADIKNKHIEINNNSHDAHKYLKHVIFSSDEFKDSYEQRKLKYDI